ncbi:MAG TPA: T9SS type A sorting domain-containing protein [Crocinitomicaceae bacterium]|nr:T9SS type A sorting domain-containing protein [Crocinitomicaceae bacterium]
MKKLNRTTLLTSLALILVTSISYSQVENEQSDQCRNRDKSGMFQVKSNSLNIPQIAETEKYDVHFYAIDIAMNNLVTDVAGNVEIHGTAVQNLDSVLFELFATMTITDIRLNGATTNFSRNGSAVKVPVNITTGQPFVLSIDYNGTPPTGATNPLGGSGMSNATSGSWGNQATWSLSESFAAYEWWPCKQSLTDKADSCSVKITVPSICKAGSNGILENVVDLGNGTTRYEWMHKHPIDYYLISVAVAQYVEYNVYANPVGAPGQVLIQNFIYDNPQTLINFQNDIDETVDFMELFANLYGPYPFDDEKYGHCMVPLGGGMEHQTMTTQGWFTKGLTSHELGHQWWGDNVTCASWADIWVNEGFATYSAYLMLENLYPGEDITDMENKHTNIKSNPSGSVWCLDSLNEGRIFSGRLSYDKGAAIIHTFRFLMNDDVAFFQALKNIQNDFSGGTAFGIDIRDYFVTASGVDLTAAFNEWYFGEGYPTYSAKWNQVGTDLHLEVSHTTSSTTPLFTNDLELKFSRSGLADTTIRIAINSNTQQVVIPGLQNVTNLTQIDPNNWVINNNGTIQNDASLNVAGIGELSISDTYTISPNPSNGHFSISSSENTNNTIEIRDLKGRLIYESNFSSKTTIDISQEQSGYYILFITNNNGDRRIKTIIKE